MRSWPQTGRTQPRLRELPSRVVVYLLLAAASVRGAGLSAGVVAAGRGPGRARPVARRRRPCARPVAGSGWRRCGRCSTCCVGRPGRGQAVRWRGLLVCAIDGTTLSVPDSPANLAVTVTRAGNHGGSGLPAAAAGGPGRLRHPRLDRGSFGPYQQGETTHAPDCSASLRAGMLRAGRPQLRRRRPRDPDRRHRRASAGALQDQPPAARLRRCRDGSWTSVLGGVPVRVVDAEITTRHQRRPPDRQLPAGHHPADHHRYPARDLVARSTTSAGRSKPPTWS